MPTIVAMNVIARLPQIALITACVATTSVGPEQALSIVPPSGNTSAVQSGVV